MNSDTESAPESVKNENGEEETRIKFSVVDQHGTQTFFMANRSMQMGKMFRAYAKNKGVDVTSLRFLYDGQRIQDTATVGTLELEADDVIDVMHEQVGGGS